MFVVFVWLPLRMQGKDFFCRQERGKRVGHVLTIREGGVVRERYAGV